MIRQVSFKHGWYYYYRVHLDKLDRLSGEDTGLRSYLLDVFDNCPHEYFATAPRGSALRFSHSIALTSVPHHEMMRLARLSDSYAGRYKAAHSRVEMFLLENDEKTLAVEVPLWLSADEAGFYDELFHTPDPLTGHIDILRKEGDYLYIWDYKPKARREKYAALQVLFYALMLSRRSGIALSRFRCGYFDEENTYVFRPEMAQFSDLVARNAPLALER